MKLYTCSNCNNSLYFENSFCLKCNHAVGFIPEEFLFTTLENTTVGYTSINHKNRFYRYCPNAVLGTCNWLIPVENTNFFCTACQLNRTIPDLINIDNQLKWKRIEIAKHRLVYSLLRLGLPIKSKAAEPEAGGIAFDFMADTSPAKKVMTGHDNGLITLNIEEANEILSVTHRLNLGEKYRTLLGHFRHEIGHYYWDVLIQNGRYLEKFRKIFGSEAADYGKALEQYYKTQTPANWNNNFISPYATAHPWEDWAETWAHYMHMMDTLETAWSFGIGVQLQSTATIINDDPYTIQNFNTIIERWFPIAFAVNSLNRSMGHADFYPFVISAPVIEKLQFIHEVCRVGMVKNS